MNIYDISEKAGVSIATVSRVLNGNSKVSEKTRQKILKVMEDTGYQPNVFARGLGLNTMNTIGILCADCSDLVLASVVYHVEQELRKHNYDMLLSCTGYDIETKKKSMTLLLSKRVDGLILVGSNFVAENPEDNQYIIDAAKEIPVMIINGYLDAENVYCTVCDDRNIMHGVTSKFLEKTEHILYLHRSLTYSGRKKIQGIKEAFEEKRTELRPEQILLFNGNIDETRKFLKDKWQSGARWDVIMTSDDELAIGAMKFANEMNLRIPEDIQIAGYNNSRISICCNPELTSVDNHMEESGKCAVERLMMILAGEEVPKKKIIEGEKVIRGTTKDL